MSFISSISYIHSISACPLLKVGLLVERSTPVDTEENGSLSMECLMGKQKWD